MPAPIYARPSRLCQAQATKEKAGRAALPKDYPKSLLQQGRWPLPLLRRLTNFRGFPPPPPPPPGSPAPAATEDSSALLPFFFSRAARPDPLPPLSIAPDYWQGSRPANDTTSASRTSSAAAAKAEGASLHRRRAPAAGLAHQRLT